MVWQFWKCILFFIKRAPKNNVATGEQLWGYHRLWAISNGLAVIPWIWHPAPLGCADLQIARIYKLRRFTNCADLQIAQIYNLRGFINCTDLQIAQIYKLRTKMARTFSLQPVYRIDREIWYKCWRNIPQKCRLSCNCSDVTGYAAMCRGAF